MNVKGFIADQLGFLRLEDVPVLLFNMVLASLITFLLSRVRTVWRGRGKEAALYSAIITLIVGIIKGSLPLAVSLVAVLLLVRPDVTGTKHGQLLMLMAVVVGAGCGASAGLVVIAAAPVLAFLLWWARDELT